MQVDLAVAIVVGTAFTAVVKALVADIITPLIAAIYGGQAFTDLYFTVHNSKFLIGDFINAVRLHCQSWQQPEKLRQWVAYSCAA